MRERDDPFGRAFLDYMRDSDTQVVLERDDGYLEAHPLHGYFSGPESWPAEKLTALDSLSGRVLDVGCGAGRVALYLQDRGLDVVGIDISPGTVEVARSRGVRDVRELSFTQIGPSLGTFDAVVFAGNNLGLAGTPKRLAWMLRRLKAVTTPAAVVVADGIDPYTTTEPDHLAYHERNRSRGLPGGQIRVRVRYRQWRDPWWNLLLQSRDELTSNIAGTGWRVRRFTDEVSGEWSPGERSSGTWAAVLEREP